MKLIENWYKFNWSKLFKEIVENRKDNSFYCDDALLYDDIINGTEELTGEHIINCVTNKFGYWAEENIDIVYGKKQETVKDTYGFPYTSSGFYAAIWNTNVDAVYKWNREFHFEGLAITEQGDIVALFKRDWKGYDEYSNEYEMEMIVGSIC